MIVYSTTLCGDCLRAKRFLDTHGIEYTVVDIDTDQDAAREVVRLNGGYQTVPTIVFSDGSVIVEPSNRELADKLKIPI